MAIIPKPFTPFITIFFKWNPPWWAYERFVSLTTGQGVERLWKSFPPSRLYSHKFLRPIDDFIDDAIYKSGIIQAVKSLDEKLIDLRVELERNKTPECEARVIAAAEREVSNFSRTHRKKFADLDLALLPLRNELENYPASNDGEVGLDEHQIQSVKSCLNLISELSNATQTESTLVNYYQESRKPFLKRTPAKTAESISGAMQHFLHFTAGAELRVVTRPYHRPLLGWRPFTKFTLNPIEALRQTKLLNCNYQYERKGIEKVKEKGGDGFYHLRYEATSQNIEARRRGFREGYFSPRIRTTTITDNPKGEANDENYSLVLSGINEDFSDPKTGSLKPEVREDDYAGRANKQIKDAYTAGRVFNALTAYRRLCWKQGPGGAKFTFPARSTELLKKEFEQDEDFLEVIEAMSRLEQRDDSPAMFGPRHANQLGEKYTRIAFGARVAAGRRISGTPGKIDVWTTPKAVVITQIISKVTGSEVTPNQNRAGRTVEFKPIKVKYTLASPFRAIVRILTGGISSSFDKGKKSWPFTKRGIAALVALGGIWAAEQAVETQTGELNLNAAQRIGGVPLKAADLTLGSIFRSITGSEAHIPGHNWTFQRLFGQDPVSPAKALEQDIASVERMITEARTLNAPEETIEKYTAVKNVLGLKHKIVQESEKDIELEQKLTSKSSLTPAEHAQLAEIGKRMGERLEKMNALEERLQRINESINKNTPLPDEEKPAAGSPPKLSDASAGADLSHMFNAKPSGNVTAPGGMLATIFSGGAQGNVKIIKKTPMYGDAKPGTDSPEHTIA